MLLQSLKIAPLLSWSIITKIFVKLLLIGSYVIKSINISLYIRSGIGSGFKKPCLQSCYALFWLQESQLYTNCYTNCAIPGQKNCYIKIAIVPSLLGCPQIRESCVTWTSLVCNSSETGTQQRSLNRSALEAISEHSNSKTRTLKDNGNTLFLLRIVVTIYVYVQSLSQQVFYKACRSSSRLYKQLDRSIVLLFWLMLLWFRVTVTGARVIQLQAPLQTIISLISQAICSYNLLSIAPTRRSYYL